jgi:hypothetical protein
MNQNDVAIRKRTQISKANRTMFIWIAVASALIGAAVVVSIFLGQKLIYNEKVLGEKQTTVSTLDHNLSVVEDLKTDVQALEANSALGSVKANETDQALQVVLDALPSDANSLALGASLQNKILSGIEGGSYTIEAISVIPVEGIEVISGSSDTSDASASSDSGNKINFSFSVKGEQAALKQILQNLERSIRTMIITSVVFQVQEGGLTMDVQGYAFYEPAKVLELTDKKVKAE